MELEMVGHCWRYSRLLTYQLSSIVNCPPKLRVNKVVVTVCYCPEDDKTKKVLEFFEKINISRVSWNWMPLSKPELTNRAIGRNKAALSSKADWIHFCDVDYVVQEGFFDSLSHTLFNQCKRDKLVYPDSVGATTKEYGLELIEAASGEPRLLEVQNDPKKVVQQKFRKAIGGIQFSPTYALQQKQGKGEPLGYLNNRRNQHPYQDGNWRPDIEDRRFRISLGTPGRAINCPGLIRIRHAERGGPDKVVDL